jgi:hypothetical protein
LLYDLGLVGLGGNSTVQPLGLKGGLMFWASDGSPYYADTLSSTWCAPEHNRILRLDVASKTTSVVVDPVGRVPGVVVAPSKGLLAYTNEEPNGCWSPNTVVRIAPLGGGTSTLVSWSSNGNVDKVFGLAADESAFLVQSVTGYSPPSTISIVGWDGSRAVIYSSVPADDGGCQTARRLGPTGVFYCNETDGNTYRLDLRGSTPVQIACVVNGAAAKIVEVFPGS